MKEKLRFLGLDIHAETIAVAIAEPDGEVRGLTPRRGGYVEIWEVHNVQVADCFLAPFSRLRKSTLYETSDKNRFGPLFTASVLSSR